MAANPRAGEVPEIRDVDTLQRFLAEQLGGEPFDYACTKPETLQLAIDLGVGEQARAVIATSREMAPVIDATVERAKRSELVKVEQLRARQRDRAGGAPLPIVWLEQAALPRQQAGLVKGLIGARDLVMVYGEPSCGKTFLVVDLACHIAACMPWRGLRTKGGMVVYVAAEAGRSILRRFVAWRDRHVSDAHEGKVPLAVVTAAVNLMLPVEVEELIVQLQELAAQAPIALVVFDTLSRSMPGGDENTAADMTRVVAAADRIRDELGAAALIVHHSGKDRTKGARGHSALAAAADTVISVAGHVAKVEKVRDGVAGQEYAFALDVVHLGVDEDKDPVTTCVAMPAEHGEAPREARTGAVRGKNEEAAIDVLRRLLASTRKMLEGRGEDPAKACIETIGWKEAVQKRLKLDDDAFRPRWREVFHRLANEKRLVRIDGSHVHLVETP